MLLLRAMLDAASRRRDSCGPLPDVETAWETLIDLENRAPAQFADVLMQPQVGMWIAHCLRRLRGQGTDFIPLWVDVGYVFNVALAVAARAGIEIRLTVPNRAGAVMVPALGLARLPDDSPFGVADTVVDSGRIQVSNRCGTVEIVLPGITDSDGWWALRRLRSRSGEHEVAIWLDDIDPYRDIAEPIPPDRLPGAQVEKWQQLLDGAFAILVQDNLGLAAAMSVGLAVVVPVPAGTSAIRSASSGDSSGSALISIPSDATGLAVTLVHEFQHIKLGSLLHLVALYRDDERLRLYAPWRDDPRPARGLLQGIYAFLGITEFWRLRRRSCVSPEQRSRAEFEFALWRKQTAHALRALRSDDSLTDLGRRFADGMAATMRAWPGEQVSHSILTAAETAARDHRAEWRIRHVQPDPGYVAELATALRRGYTVPVGAFDSRVVPDAGEVWSHRRTRLTRLRVTAPEEFRDLSRSDRTGDGQRGADVALVSGDYRGAADEYCRLLAADPRLPEAWTGLVIALSAGDKRARPLLSYPELLPTLYRALGADPAKLDPRPVAYWLCRQG
jgi:HEXXH motif-containing protein